MDRSLQRALVLPFVWFAPDTELLGAPARSLSLCSHQAVRVMGLRVLDPLAVYADPLDEARELLAYTWLHTAPVDQVSRALWDGDWRQAMSYEESAPEATLAVLAEWRELRERILALMAATEIRVEQPTRKTGSASEPPPPADMIYPLRLTAQIAAVARELGETKERAAWHVPLWEAWQIYHCARRADGLWTFPARDRSVPEETFEHFEVAALTPGEGQNGG